MNESTVSLLEQSITFLASNHFVLGYALTTILLFISFIISMKIAAGGKSTKEDFRRLVDFNNFNSRTNRERKLLSR